MRRAVRKDDLVHVEGVGYCLVVGEPSGEPDEAIYEVWRNGVQYLRTESQLRVVRGVPPCAD